MDIEGLWLVLKPCSDPGTKEDEDEVALPAWVKFNLGARSCGSDGSQQIRQEPLAHDKARRLQAAGARRRRHGGIMFNGRRDGGRMISAQLVSQVSKGPTRCSTR